MAELTTPASETSFMLYQRSGALVLCLQAPCYGPRVAKGGAMDVPLFGELGVQDNSGSTC